jgi:hypothetical protein
MKAYCTPESCKVGSMLRLEGQVHKITGVSPSGLITFDVLGKDFGRIGRVNKAFTEIEVDMEHDWKAQVAI